MYLADHLPFGEGVRSNRSSKQKSYLILAAVAVKMGFGLLCQRIHLKQDFKKTRTNTTH